MGRRSGGRSQRTDRRATQWDLYLRRLPINTVIHTTLVGLDALPVVPLTHQGPPNQTLGVNLQCLRQIARNSCLIYCTLNVYAQQLDIPFKMLRYLRYFTRGNQHTKREYRMHSHCMNNGQFHKPLTANQLTHVAGRPTAKSKISIVR